MALTEKTLKVLNLSEIPKELVEGNWIMDIEPGVYVQAHIDENEPENDLNKWVKDNYPELISEQSFLIYLDVDLME